MSPNIVEIAPVDSLGWLKGHTREQAITDIIDDAKWAISMKKAITNVKVGTTFNVSLPDYFHPQRPEFKIVSIVYGNRFSHKIKTSKDEFKVVNFPTKLLIRYPKDPDTEKVIYKVIPESIYDIGSYKLPPYDNDSLRKYLHSTIGGHDCFEYFTVRSEDGSVYGIQAIAKIN